jgi:hypothetical protein
VGEEWKKPMIVFTWKSSITGSNPVLTAKIKVMNEDRIIKIYNKRLKKYWECSYGAFLKNWGKYGWVIVN